MIEIKTLTKSEREQLCFNVEDWFPRYNKPTAFKPQFNRLKEDVNIPNSDKEVWAFICCITKAIRYGNSKSYMTFSAEVYNYTNKITKKPLNHSKMTKVCNRLEDLGYLTRYKGFNFEEDSSCSVLVFHNKLLEMFNEYLCKQYGMARDLCIVECYETVYIKNSSGKEHKVKHYVDLKGKRGLGLVKQSLLNYNKLLTDSTVEVTGCVRNDLVYKRVFEVSLSLAGRWYSIGDFQTLPKSYRETIKIQGRNTCCVDYSATHPNFIRTLLNIPEPVERDSYTIQVDFDCDKEELRSLCKVGLMCILYNRSKGKATQALTSKITKDKAKRLSEQSYPTINRVKGLAGIVIDKLVELNNDISPMFFTEKLWAVLQGYDAQCAQYIIDHFTNRGILILPWHDGFVINSGYEEDLRKVMYDAWNNVMGNTIHCKVTTEFRNNN